MNNRVRCESQLLAAGTTLVRIFHIEGLQENIKSAKIFVYKNMNFMGLYLDFLFKIKLVIPINTIH